MYKCHVRSTDYRKTLIHISHSDDHAEGHNESNNHPVYRIPSLHFFAQSRWMKRLAEDRRQQYLRRRANWVFTLKTKWTSCRSQTSGRRSRQEGRYRSTDDSSPRSMCRQRTQVEYWSLYVVAQEDDGWLGYKVLRIEKGTRVLAL